MQTGMITRLNSVLDDRMKDDAKKKAYQENSMKKFNANTFGRVFDGIDVLDNETLDEMVVEYCALLNMILTAANKNDKFSRISDIDADIFFRQSPILDEWVKFINDLILQEPFYTKYKNFLQTLANMSYDEVLDGNNRLRWDTIQRLAWHTTIHVHNSVINPQILSGFFNAAIAMITHSLSLNVEHTAGFCLVQDSIVRRLSRDYRQTIEELVDNNSRSDFFAGYASEFSSRISKQCNPENLFFVEKMMQTDLDVYRGYGLLHQRALEFWLSVLFNCGIIQEQNGLFIKLWKIFAESLVVNVAPFKDYKIISDLESLDKRFRNIHMHCEKLYSRLTKTVALSSLKEDEQKHKMPSEEFKISLQRCLTKRDRATVADAIVNQYLSVTTKESERKPGEMEVLRPLIDVDTYKRYIPIGELLASLYRKLNVDGLRDGKLAEIFKTYSSLFPGTSQPVVHPGFLRQSLTSQNLSTTPIDNKPNLSSIPALSS